MANKYIDALSDLGVEALSRGGSTVTRANPRILSTDFGVQYFNSQQSFLESNNFKVLDNEWVSRAFMVSGIKLKTTSVYDKKNRYYSSASLKYTSNKLGCSIGINARPGFTPYADIPPYSIMQDQSNNISKISINNHYGMGRFYSEAIDDNAQTIYMRFGVPAYSSLLRYFTTAFDYNALSLVRTGSISMSYSFGQAIGFGALFAGFPILALSGLALGIINNIFKLSSSKLFTFRPTMHVYWITVNRLVNYVAMNKGFLPKMSQNEQDHTMNSPWKLDEEAIRNLSNVLGDDVFTEDGGFDVLAIANKGQQRAILFNEKLRELAESGDPNALFGFINDIDSVKESFNSLDNLGGKKQSMRDYLSTIEDSFGDLVSWFKDEDKPTPTKDSEGNTQIELSEVSVSIGDPEEFEKKYAEGGAGDDGWLSRLYEYFKSELRDGAGFAIFKVDYTGPVSESFSNSVSNSSIISGVNTISAQVRDFRFAINTATEVLPGMSSALSMVTDHIAGIIGGMTFNMSNLFYGMGVGFIDVPKMWTESSSALPSSNVTYKMDLISPYGNPYSQMQNQIIPLCMIMAGGMPRATGAQSHGSPFICQLYDRGRVQVRTGMITNLSVTRGTSNLGFSKGGIPMGIEVTFKVEDLINIMACPVASGSAFSNAVNLVTLGAAGTNPYIDEDNPLTDYLAVLAGIDVYSQIYMSEKARLNFARNYYASFKEMTSPASWASWIAESTTSGLLSIVRMPLAGNAALAGAA